MIYGYESDGQSDDNLSDQTKSTNNLKNKETEILSYWTGAINFLRQFDPLSASNYNYPSSTSHSYSNTLVDESSNSTEANYNYNCELYDSSNRISNDTNSYGNDICQENNNQYDSLSTQHMDPHFTPKSLHLLVIFIAFEYRNIERPNFNNCHLKGYHPIIRHFGSPKIDGDNALHFVHDSIINCWANSWKVALVVLGDVRELNHFFTEIREIFDGEILDIIFIQPFKPSYLLPFPRYFNRLDINVAKDENWKQEYDKIMNNVIQKAYLRNKYNGDEILFYNKDEPYYEFTNFYRAPIWVDYEQWPSTEHYFQAAKFNDQYLRDQIRFSYSAREAFTIARRNNSHKRIDWELPKPPDNEIFKESVMRHALLLKFMQHKKLKYKLLSTGKVKIFEHTENDRYWGDGGENHDGLNKLGIMLQETRKILMEEEQAKLINKYKSHQHVKWILTELEELQQFDDLMEFD